MKLIKPSYEILEQGPGLEGIYEAIERAGRTCYKSTRPEGQTAKNFVDRMVASKHYAMLEHGTVYLRVPCENLWIYMGSDYMVGEKTILDWPWVECFINAEDDCAYITSNYRWIIENDLSPLLEFICEPTEFHERRVSVKFGTDIGVTRELNRHRVDSVAEQSTRYCNYSKDKFNNEIAVSLNEDISDKECYDSWKKWARGDIKKSRAAFRGMCERIANYKDDEFSVVDIWVFGNAACEYAYMELIKRGWKPEQARRILPLDLHTEIVHTAFVSDWQHCFDLRVDGTTGKPHPDMKALMSPVKEEFIKRGYINAN